MSRKVLIVAAVVAMLLATSVAPALAAPFETETAFPVDARPGAGSSLPVWSPGIQPQGGCENGGAGGCPLTG